jgi:hypothetical protein
MKLTIDNLDGRGAWDYSAYVEDGQTPRLVRRLNKPAELRFSLVASVPDFVVPANGARVMLGRLNGQDLFTGYIVAAPKYEYLGWGLQGPVYRYTVVARSDEVLLDRKTIRRRFPFVARSAGDALRQLAEDLMPGRFDTSRIQAVDNLPSYACDPQQSWTEHAAEIALRGRGCYRALDGRLIFEAVGATSYSLSETDSNFCPEGLTLVATDALVNDVTVVGLIEPQAHVKDYFVGDGYSLKFYLSQVPFMSTNRTMLDEEYLALDTTRWSVTDPGGAIRVTAGKLVVGGGTGRDGQTCLTFADKIEMGGTMFLQHGDVAFDAASAGILGGLYTDVVMASSCFAGFDITPVGGQSRIQARLSGNLTGASLTTQAGHHYVLTTRLYSSEVYRLQQIFHSSTHVAGAGRGGATMNADVRVVLEVHDIDPANPASQVAASTVLFDGIIGNAPAFCVYAPVNASDLHCNFTFTRMTRAVNAEVRSALPGQAYRTRLAGSLSDGAQCKVSKEPSLQFFPQTMPAPNELIMVHYRGSGRALARVNDPASIGANARNGDDGVRGLVRNVKAPSPCTAQDCEQGAIAILENATGLAWSGEYKTWSDFLPGGAADIFPGDELDVSASSRGASFRAIVREVDVDFVDLAGEHSQYAMRFADDAAQSLTMEFDAGRVINALDLNATPVTQVGANVLPDLTQAEILIPPTSTTVTIDAGLDPPPGGGIEVRWSDTGWGASNDRNLVGRFNVRSFTVPRLGRVQDYFLRQYDNSSPAKYSRYSAALHLDYPL